MNSKASRPLVLQNSKTIVLWGSDLLKNQQANWWCPDHDVYEYYRAAKKRKSPPVGHQHGSGCHIPPMSIWARACERIAVNPQTDVAATGAGVYAVQ
ncbi:hypothetical protein ACLK1T_01215 [Escherichia coli]